MSLLSKLFGGKSKVKDIEPELYKGFLIFPEPVHANGVYRIAARIEKEIAGEVKVHNLMRVDTLTTEEEASQASVNKAKVFIDQMGDGVFG
ncbi:HlyU family transcriptional regulator [Pacificibacter marinus]|uniref:Transcriptional activator HlyU n=1 Tax=Pacificibacter marinus TaxID=658057 RepID=A0A1Y5SNY1_9RHOB|nr:HlyU family transcriptional regulator [Pacificibacter marinus]SEK60525.1 hypothetical protein SAMN04488032_104107 [Pacificibacter marinus]SLN41952.1 Transcriptional activator HlyU [Pacificibacter marinus]